MDSREIVDTKAKLDIFLPGHPEDVGHDMMISDDF